MILKKEPSQIDKLKKELNQAASHFKGETEPIPKPAEQIAAEQQIQEWKEKKSSERQDVKKFETAKKILSVTLNTNQFSGLILYGEGGIGKTLLVVNAVKEHFKPNEWEYSSGYTTALSLYKFLYANRDRKVIILDDMEGVWDNKKAETLLKGTLWEVDGKRIVQYSSTAEVAQDVPNAFIINAKIVILANQLPKGKDTATKAMLTRTINYELTFSYAEKIAAITQFVNSDNSLSQQQKTDVLKIISEKTSEATDDMNFRTLRKAIAFIMGTGNEKEAENLFAATTSENETIKAFLEAEKKSGTIAEQVAYFNELIGKSRATFFRIKDKLRGNLKVASVSNVIPNATT